MKIGKATSRINNQMMKVTNLIDNEKEVARLQGAALAGILLGAWVAIMGVELGYSPIIVGSIITVGFIGGIASRAIV